MTEQTIKHPWQNPNGTTKPEWTIQLKHPLSDGTKVLALTEPNIKALRKATKLLVYSEKGEPTTDSGIAFGVSLIASICGLSEDVVEELPQGVFGQSVEFLQSFT